MIKIGQTVRDSITGFKGLVTGRVEYITGCTQLLVQPPLDEKGTFIEGRYIDEDRCTLVDGSVFVLPTKTVNGSDKAAPVK